MKKEIIWVVLRDGKPYVYRKTKKGAEDVASYYRPGSKHEWTVEERRVSKKP